MSTDPELDALKDAMDAVTPAPDATRRAENIALARKNFDNLQGSRGNVRPTPDRPARGAFMSGVIAMLQNKSRAALLATSALAVGVVFTINLNSAEQEPFFALFPSEEVSISNDTPEQSRSLLEPPLAEETEVEMEEPLRRELAEAEIVLDLAETAEAAGLGLSIPQPDVIEAEPMIAPQENAQAPTQPPVVAGILGYDVEDGPVAQGTINLSEEADDGIVTRSTEAGDQAPIYSETLADIPMFSDSGELENGLNFGQPVQGGLDDAPIQTRSETEEFADAPPSDLQIVREAPVATFSIDVDTASYSILRSSLNRGQLPPEGAVRIEEMINYFPYDYPAPGLGDEAPFRPTVSVFETPWNPDTQLLHIGLQGIEPAIEDRPPLNLVFLVDVSGSMDDPAKLPLLVQSLRLMLGELRPEDEVAIVTYAGNAGVALAPTPASERRVISDALERLQAGGSTNGTGGLVAAYGLAEQMTAAGEVSRVILATDGDFNVGISDPDALTDFIAAQRDSGTYLSVLGFGRGNLQDDTMQALAQNGNGTAAYIDTLHEAQRVLVDQLSGALFPIADDVKLQVEFNPDLVAEYRLIGYESRALAREDFNNDAVDAGELGAGHTVTAIFEITPVGSPAVRVPPLRYGDELPVVSEFASELGFLQMRWKAPGEAESQLIAFPITQTRAPSSEAQFAAAIAGFGELLRGSDYLGAWGFDDAIALAQAHRGTDPFGYRNEAVQLMRLAESLSQ